MSSEQLRWAIDTIARNRDEAGVRADRYEVERARASLKPLNLPLPQGTREEWVEVAGLRCVWVTVPGSDPDVRMLYLHGGGYCSGDYGSHRSLPGWIAASLGCVVLFPEYRLAPEHRFPAAVDDVEACHRWLIANGPAARQVDAQTLLVAGDSAGGGLALALVQRCRRKSLRMPDAAALLCAMLDLDEASSAFLKSNQRTRDMVRHYVAWLSDLRSPEASPMCAALDEFPPLLLQTGSADYCRQDSIDFAARAAAAGLDVTLEVWPEMIHVWQRFAPELPEASAAIERMGAWFRNRTRQAHATELTSV